MLCYNALYADDSVASQRALHMAGPPNKQKGATATMERVKIVKLVDYREIPVPEKMLEVKVPGSLIDKELARAAKQHATITREAGPVASGDIVVVDTVSKDPQWQLEGYHINVGKGYCSAEVESALVGMKEGEQQTVRWEDNEVAVRVKSIHRRHIPELSDAHIVALGLDGICTIAQYRDYLFDDYGKMYTKRKVSQIADYVVTQMIEKSEFDIPDEVIQDRCREQVVMLRKQRGIAPDIPEEDFLTESLAQVFHKKIGSLEEAKKLLWEDSWNDIACLTICRHYAQADGLSFDEKAYEELITNYAKENGCAVEETRARYPYAMYCFYEPINYFKQTCLPKQYSKQCSVVLDMEK